MEMEGREEVVVEEKGEEAKEDSAEEGPSSTSPSLSSTHLLRLDIFVRPFQITDHTGSRASQAILRLSNPISSLVWSERDLSLVECRLIGYVQPLRLSILRAN